MNKNRQFKKKLIASAISSILIASAMPSLAQEESTEVLEEVVVTGIRSSLKQALDAKRNQAVVADVINADDVGKLPDNNIAEALSRIAGIQVERDGNEGAQVQLRGLDSVRLEVNGHTLASPDAEPQATSLQVIPSQLFRQISVLKSFSADQVEGGLAGTIKFDTFRPFDFDEGHAFVINADLGFSDGTDETFPRFNTYLAKAFENTAIGDIGFLYSGAIDERVNLTRQTRVSGYDLLSIPGLDVDGDGQTVQLDTSSSVDGTINDPFGEQAQFSCLDASGSPFTPPAIAGGSPSAACAAGGGFNVFTDLQDSLFFPNRVRAIRDETRSDRQSHLFTTQWRPSDRIEVVVDYLRIQERPNNIASDLFFNNQPNRNFARLLPENITFNPETRNVTSFFIGDVNETPVTRGANIFFGSQSRESRSTTENFDIDATFEVNDALTVQARYNRAEGQTASNTFAPFQNFATVAGGNVEDRNVNAPFQRVTVGSETLGLELFENGTTTPIDILSFSPFVNGANDNTTFASNEQDTFSLDFDLNLDRGHLESIEFGLRYADAESQISSSNRSTFSDGGRPRVSFDDLEAAIPGSTGIVDAADFTQTGSINLPGAFRIIDPSQFLTSGARNNLRDFFFDAVDVTATTNLSNNNTVEEENLAGYFKANFSGELANMPYQASFGVRYVDVDRVSSNEDPEAEAIAISHDDFLPTFNAKLNISDDLVLRAAASRNISRYEFNNVRNNENLDEETLAGSGGNGALLPETVNSFDLSLEWYPADGAVVAAALYYKNIEDFISTSVSQQCRFLPSTTIFSDGDRVSLSPFVNQCLDGVLGDISSPLPANGLVSDAQLAAGTVALPFTFTGPVNGTQDVDLYGIELQYQQNFTFLPAPWDGLGVQINYTYTDLDNSGFTAAGNELRRRGLSENSFNFTAFYEKGPLELRLAYNYRDEFLPNIGDLGGAGDGGLLLRDAVDQLEASASYAVNDKIDLTFSAVNLLADDRFSFFDTSERLGRADVTERTFFAGVRFKL